MFKLMNICQKRLISLRNSQRLKAMFLEPNIYNMNAFNNHCNERPLTVFGNCWKSVLNGNRCPFNPSLVLKMSSNTQTFDESTYELIADQTLEHLYEEFETLIERNGELKDSDVSLSNGVITWNLGFHGIYVINKQTPNKQIWFSSPISGPKRYDYVNREWIYKRDGTSLFTILGSELSQILNREIKIKALSL